MYFSGTKRQAWNFEFANLGDLRTAYSVGPPLTTADMQDQATYVSKPFTRPAALLGPITADLWVMSLAQDSDLFVQVIDQGPDGSRSYLNRGTLKASHRAIDYARSDCVNPATNLRVSCVGGNGKPAPGALLYRPWRPHTSSEDLEIGATYRYLVEIWPVGWIFRPGHRLVVTVQAPPASDSLYMYPPTTLPTINTILHDAAHPSSITLPFVGMPSRLGSAIACGFQTAVRCVESPQG